MPNPTGSVFLQADQNYVWTDGDVYEIVQTDEVEGAATGASFNGIGVDNQPHQVLLNKVSHIRTVQVTQQEIISTLQQFTTLAASNVGLNGWMKFPSQDVNLGMIQIIIQWGTLSLLPYSAPGSLPQVFTFSFPIRFPNAVWILLPWWQANMTSGKGEFGGLARDLAPQVPLQLQTNHLLYDALSTVQIADASRSVLGITGIGWLAVGY
jgi:hypothetical protein